MAVTCLTGYDSAEASAVNSFPLLTRIGPFSPALSSSPLAVPPCVTSAFPAATSSHTISLTGSINARQSAYSAGWSSCSFRATWEGQIVESALWSRPRRE